MKPTRKDLIRVLRERALQRIEAQIKELAANKPATDNSIREEVQQTAMNQFRRVPANRAVLKKLDESGVPYTMQCVDGHWKKSVYHCRVGLYLNYHDATEYTTPLTDKQVARRTAIDAAAQAHHDALCELTRQKSVLHYDESGTVMIDMLISKILVDGDTTIQSLIESLETKLTAALAEAVATTK